MGKLTAIIVGYVSITFASYAILSLSYSPLVNWLGPYFGFRFPFILGIIYLIAGSPIKNSIILETWITIGVIVGISARKGTRAWGSATILFLLTTATLTMLMLGILGISLLGSNGISSLSGNISAIVATVTASAAFVPYGTNLATIAIEPILRLLLPYLSSMLSSGTVSSGSATSGLKTIVMEIAYSVIENYLIFVVTSIVVGTISYRLLHKKKKISKKAVAAALSIFIAIIFIAMAFSGGIASPEQMSGYSPAASSENNIPGLALEGLFPMVIHNNTATVRSDPAVSSSSITNGSNDAGLSIITPNGDLFNFFAMENSADNGMWNSNGLMFGAVAVTANMTSIIAKEYGISVHNFGGFAPQNMILLAYNNSTPSANAASLSSSIGSKMGVTFGHILTLNNIKLGNDYVNIYIYSSSSGTSTLKSGFMKAFADSYTGSIATIFRSNEAMNNYGPFVMASGYINESIVKSVAGISVSNSSGMYFTSGVFGYEQYFHSSGTSHTYNLSALMHYDSSVSFKSTGLSLLGIGYNNGTGQIGSLGDYKFNIYTNNNTLAGSSPLNTSGSTITSIGTSSFSPSSVSVSFNAVFPAYLYYSTIVDRLSSNEVKITVHITNNDNNNLTEFNASQGAFVKNYDGNNASKLISGKYSESGMKVAPGQSANFSYTMELAGNGIYTIPYTNISYNFQGKAFSYQTNATYITQNKPGYVYAMNTVINQQASQYSILGNVLFSFSGFAFSFMDIILLLIVLIDVRIEVKGLRKMLKTRKEE